MVNFNEAPYLGDELHYIKDAIDSHHISGDGKYTKLCNEILTKRINSKASLLTHSCTAALEMSALLLNVKEGDEVICPSYTFVTTASSFALRGCKLVFVDIKDDTLNIDETQIENAITSKTKAIVPVHYAGVSAEMDTIMEIAHKHNLAVVEDAAQAVGSFYKDRSCGSIGDLGCLSFHETKNISSREGGAILINNEKFIEDAEIIREKGTNRSKFFRGYVDKYTWVELGSSYLPSDMIAAYLYPQLLKMKTINEKRINIWNKYNNAFKEYENKGIIKCPFVPNYCKHNAHMYYLRFENLEIRTKFIDYMKKNDIGCVFHYIPLHSSPAGQNYGRYIGDMKNTNNVSETLVRLPLYYSIDDKTQDYIIDKAIEFIRGI